MTHKHVQVVIEDMQYSQTIDAWTAINDLIDYINCVEKGNAESHYEKCLLYKAPVPKEEKDEAKEKDVYATVADLRRVIQQLPDDAKVYYQRIEDVYFDKHGWKAGKLTPDPDILRLYNEVVNEEWIRAWCAFKAEDGDLHITAHY